MKLFGRGKNGAVAKKSAPLAGGMAVVFPGPEGWELWSGLPGQPVCTGPAEVPGKLKPAPGCVLGLPSRSFYSVPLWVPVVEESPAREQTQIKLELKGLLGANPDAAVWNFAPLRREELPAAEDGSVVFRELESTAVLASPFPEDWLVEAATRYEPAGRMLPPPESGTTGALRRELGRWVADFYLGGKWFHSQPLLSPQLDAAAAVELTTTLAQMEGEGILSRVDGWWVRDGRETSKGFQQVLGVPVRHEERGAPRLVAENWNLPPPALTERRAERAQSAQRKKLIRGSLLVYAVVGFAVLSFLAWPLVRLKLGQAELKKIGPESESIRSAAMLWREAGAWLDPRRNAVELLWQVSRPLIESEPAAIEGVRLTLFDLNAKRLLLQGEGKDLERVEKYLQWLKNDPALAGFTWKHPQPRLLPNGNAQFQTEGIPPGVSVEEQEGEQNENPDAP